MVLTDKTVSGETQSKPGFKFLGLDPDFDAKLKAFYYVRVLEIPTPRWTAHDAKRFGVKPLPGTRTTVTERAYTSPNHQCQPASPSNKCPISGNKRRAGIGEIASMHTFHQTLNDSPCHR